MDERYKLLEYLPHQMVRIAKKCPDCGLWHAVILNEKYYINDDDWFEEICSICANKNWVIKPDTDWND